MHLIPATGLGLKQNSKLLEQQPQLVLAGSAKVPLTSLFLEEDQLHLIPATVLGQKASSKLLKQPPQLVLAGSANVALTFHFF